jgi:membrane protein required for colicin V production
MTWVDIAIVVIILISAVISLFRGLIKEVLSLLSWIVAIWLALTFTNRLAPAFAGLVSLPSAQQIVAFLVIFIGALLCGALINYLIGRLVAATGLTGTDRALGTVFGVLRGWAIVVLLVLLAGATAMPRDPWWRESRLLGHFQGLAEVCLAYLPESVAQHVDFSQS